MTWSKAPPTEPGFYWWRQGKRVEVACIKHDGIGLVIGWMGEREVCPKPLWQPHWEWWPEKIDVPHKS